MSWLFDRLCELAVADRVDVVIHAELPSATHDESVRLADVLVRAARARQFSMTVLRGGPAGIANEDDIVIDLELLGGDDDAEDAVAALVPPPTDGGWFAHVEQGVVVVGEAPASPTRSGLEGSADGGVLRRCIAGGRADVDELLAGLGTLDLGIVVGGEPLPGIHVVDDVEELLVVLDALVVLRHVAFGTDAHTATDGTELLRRPRLRSLMST